MEQRVIVGQAQTLVSYPRLVSDDLVQGVPSSVYCKIWTPTTAPTDYVAATADSYSETVTAAADIGDTEIAVSSGDIVAGRLYLLEDDGYTQVIEARSGGSAQTTFRLAQPLARAVSTSATVKGFAVTKALTTDQTAQGGPGSVQWKATVNGAVVEWAQNFRIAKRLPRMTLTPSRLGEAFGSVLAATPPTDPNLEGAILGAWKYDVVPLIENRAILDEDVTSGDALEALHAVAVILALYNLDPRVDDTFKARTQALYDERVRRTFARVTLTTRSQLGDPVPLVTGGEPDRSRIVMKL